MIAKRLTELRHDKGLTQQEVAVGIGVSRTTYAHYEIGRREPDIGTLTTIAKFFEVSTDYLLGLTDLRKPYTLEENSPVYAQVLNALTDANKEGFTPDDIREVNPEIASLMQDNSIIRAKAKMDLIEQNGLSLKTLQKLVSLVDQIKKESTQV